MNVEMAPYILDPREAISKNLKSCWPRLILTWGGCTSKLQSMT